MDVRIRPWQPADAPALAAIANNKKIWNLLRNRFPHPYTLQEAENWITMNTQTPLPEHMCIEADGEVCGGIGFIPGADIEERCAELGYFLGDACQGRGIATKALGLLVQHMITHYRFVRLYAIVFSNNPASMRVLQKNGFYLEQIRKKAVYKNGVIMDDYVWVRLLN
jgi:[ribosomal protein S5]-alanine N-acetyltransferase